MSVITLAQASTILDVALKKARDSKLAPLTVAVLDAGGHAVALKREDAASSGRPAIATAKAAGALVGAVGISGDTSDNDEVCAVAGILAAGLKADTGAAP